MGQNKYARACRCGRACPSRSRAAPSRASRRSSTRFSPSGRARGCSCSAWPTAASQSSTPSRNMYSPPHARPARVRPAHTARHPPCAGVRLPALRQAQDWRDRRGLDILPLLAVLGALLRVCLDDAGELGAVELHGFRLRELGIELLRRGWLILHHPSSIDLIMVLKVRLIIRR